MTLTQALAGNTGSADKMQREQHKRAVPVRLIVPMFMSMSDVAIVVFETPVTGVERRAAVIQFQVDKQLKSN